MVLFLNERDVLNKIHKHTFALNSDLDNFSSGVIFAEMYFANNFFAGIFFLRIVEKIAKIAKIKTRKNFMPYDNSVQPLSERMIGFKDENSLNILATFFCASLKGHIKRPNGVNSVKN